MMLLASPLASQPPSVKILSAIGMRQVMLQLGPRFERESRYALAIEYDSTGLIAKRVAAGEHVDVILINESAMANLAGAKRIIQDSVTPIAASVVAVAVRTNAPRPDISSPEAFKRMLLSVTTIARPSPSVGGSSGDHIVKVLQQLGVQAEVDAKSVMVQPGFAAGIGDSPGEVVAKGHADVALHQLQELIAVPGLEILGPFPGSLAGTFVFSAAIGVDTRQTSGARALIAFLTTPAARAIIKDTGMDPMTR